jgi:hypothetical protein
VLTLRYSTSRDIVESSHDAFVIPVTAGDLWPLSGNDDPVYRVVVRGDKGKNNSIEYPPFL